MRLRDLRCPLCSDMLRLESTLDGHTLLKDDAPWHGYCESGHEVTAAVIGYPRGARLVLRATAPFTEYPDP